MLILTLWNVARIVFTILIGLFSLTTLVFYSASMPDWLSSSPSISTFMSDSSRPLMIPAVLSVFGGGFVFGIWADELFRQVLMRRRSQ